MDDETVQLATELAELTGEGVSEAIVIALRELIERIQRNAENEQRLREIRAIADRCSKLLGPGPSSESMVNALYDDDGLPC